MVRKHIDINEILLKIYTLQNIINGRSVLDSTYKCKGNGKYEQKISSMKYSMWCLSVC